MRFLITILLIIGFSLMVKSQDTIFVYYQKGNEIKQTFVLPAKEQSTTYKKCIEKIYQIEGKKSLIYNIIINRIRIATIENRTRQIK